MKYWNTYGIFITPAVKYRRFYLPKFPFAALSSVDVAPLRRLLPPCRWEFILRKIRRHLTAGVIDKTRFSKEVLPWT